MPQEVYMIFVVIAALALYLLYRLQIVSNDVKRLKRGSKALSDGIITSKNSPATLATPSVLLEDESEIVAVLMAAIAAFQSENADASSEASGALPAHGFIIRRIVRIA